MKSANLNVKLMAVRAAAFGIATMGAAGLGAQTPAVAPQMLDGIVIESSADAEKRESVASKIIVTRAEIIKFGDTSLLGVLARIPGVSVGGGLNNAGEVGLRGLGSGYAQIQVNGEPVAAGFTLIHSHPISSSASRS